ncbi:diaminopimelate epimerase [Micrococcales bacterium 31B]|nr:diaminopimelate epimerase [Micrococcales bacterium 31B]
MSSKRTSLQVIKGHGTRNDFVLVPDTGTQKVGPLTPALVRALADRRAGIGGDGVVRVVRSEVAIADGSIEPLAGEPGVPEWFMDYWNADGTTSEMCGNAVRVFARYLLHMGLATAPFELLTRGGIKTAAVTENGDIEVGMGAFRLSPIEPEVVKAPGLIGDSGGRPAVSVDMSNPHTVALVDPQQDLADLDLTRQPEVLPVPVGGTNIEFVKIGAVTGGRGELDMRVHERGVGETEACGTGACASAVAAYLHVGDGAPATWLVRMPGGPVTITIDADGYTRLAGSAELVGEISLGSGWLAARGL